MEKAVVITEKATVVVMEMEMVKGAGVVVKGEVWAQDLVRMVVNMEDSVVLMEKVVLMVEVVEWVVCLV